MVGWAHTQITCARKYSANNSIVAWAAMSLSGGIIGRASALPAIPLATPMDDLPIMVMNASDHAYKIHGI